MKLFEEMGLLLRQDNVNRILIPRKILLKLFFIQIPLAAVSLLFWNGVWILVSIPLMLFWFWYERIYYKIWRQYYALVPFIVQLIIASALGFGGRGLIYLALDLVFKK